MTNNESGNTRGSPMISNMHFGNNNKSYMGLVNSCSDVSLIDWFLKIFRVKIYKKFGKVNLLNLTGTWN